MNRSCDFCKNGKLIEHKHYDIKDDKRVLIEYYVCDNCGEEIITTQQILRNEARMKAVKEFN